MTEADKKYLATTFITGLRTRDAGLLGSIMVDDVVWSLPGASLVSGEAQGVAGIIERATHFAAYALNIDILYVLYGYAGVALSLHNTGTHNGKTLDEHLTTVMTLTGSKIKRLDTYISDVAMVDDYFS